MLLLLWISMPLLWVNSFLHNYFEARPFAQVDQMKLQLEYDGNPPYTPFWWPHENAVSQIFIWRKQKHTRPQELYNRARIDKSLLWNKQINSLLLLELISLKWKEVWDSISRPHLFEEKINNSVTTSSPRFPFSKIYLQLIIRDNVS